MTEHTVAIVETRLANGLTVLIQPLRHAPVVSCWIWYRVGSRNEQPGLTGISHWVEHLLFKGTPRFPPGTIFREVNRWGGTLNGFTWLDYTAYFETLPTPGWELALDIEADRMVQASFDPAEIERERTVILAERAGRENQPSTYLHEEVLAAAFRVHPYGHPVIGYREDLLQITRDDLFQHYRTYYHPNNAVLVLVGDVVPETALAAVERAFGAIPAGPVVPTPRVREPEQWGERRIIVRRPAPTPQLLVAWRAPAATHPDIPALVVLDAVLSGGKPVAFGGSGMGRSSRLYQRLVASGFCTAAASSLSLTIDPFLFTISATLTPLADPQTVERILEELLQEVREQPVGEEELARAKRQLAMQFATANESAQSRAALLGSLAMVAPERLPEKFQAELEQVTAEDLMRVAQTYLVPELRTMGWLEPRPTPPSVIPTSGWEKSEVPPAVDSSPLDGPVGSVWFTQSGERQQQVISLPQVHLAPVVEELSEGSLLVAQTVPASRLTVLTVRIPAGAARDEQRPGIAYLTGQLLSKGTTHHSEAEFNEELDRFGATLSVSVGRDAVDITLVCLSDVFEAGVQLLAEMLLEPAFPAQQLERVRQQTLTALRQAQQSTRAQADALLRAALYPPGHPYHHRILGTGDSLEELTREAVYEFYARWYRPNGAVITLTSGGRELRHALSQVRHILARWKGKAPELSIPEVVPPQSGKRYYEALSGKQQADLALGIVTVPRHHPDFEALRLANVVLGRLGLMGRIGTRIREQAGLAYYAASSLEAGWGTGFWSAYAGVSPIHVEQTITQILEEVERFRQEGPTSEELRDAKTALLGSLVLGLSTSSGVAGVLADLAFYRLGFDYLDRLPCQLAALDEGTIGSVARRYLDPQRMQVVIVKPAEESSTPPHEPQR